MTDFKILLADNHPVLCSGLRAEIARQRGWTIIGEARTGPEAVKLARRFEPDLLIMEADLPGLNGLVVIDSVLRSVPATKIVIFSDADDPALIERALHAGAAAYVLKCSPVEELMDAIDAAMDGRMWVSPGSRADLLENYRNILAHPPGLNGPTLFAKRAGAIAFASRRQTQQGNGPQP